MTIFPEPFDFQPGSAPLLISMPHPGTKLPPVIAEALAPAAAGLCDTDWHIPRLYDFAREMGAGILAGRYSRFAIDLNRPEDDSALYTTATTGLYPSTLFDGTPVYLEGQALSDELKRAALDEIWRPYHRTIASELARLKDTFGHALLFDAHSIKGVVPRLFEGELPDFNLGTNDGKSCDPRLTDSLAAICSSSNYRYVVNGRFKGGYITRHYGSPETGIHAVQLELAQRTYMNEDPPFEFRPDRADQVRPVLREIIRTLIEWRP